MYEPEHTPDRVEEAVQAFEKAVDQHKLAEVTNPLTMAPGSTTFDSELLKLEHNLRALDYLIKTSGDAWVELNYRYYSSKAQLMESIDDEYLKSVAVVKSEKSSLVKAKLAEVMRDRDRMKEKQRLFIGLKATYIEWIQVHKKVRRLDQ